MSDFVTSGVTCAVTAYEPAPAPAAGTLILAPGAGAGQDHPFMVRLARALAERQVRVFTFDFPYRASGRRRPDPSAVLEQAWRDALRHVQGQEGPQATPLVIAGKSMGGRIATHVAAGADVDVAGVLCFGYPLRPAGRPARPVLHLREVRVPVLILQGTRDSFGGPDDMRHAVAGSSHITVTEVDGADHGFAVPRRGTGRDRDVIGELGDVSAAWIRSLTDSVRGPAARQDH